MKFTTKLIACLLLVGFLMGCGNQYSPDSKSKTFKLKNVSLITLYGPSNYTSEGISVDIAPGIGTYTTLLELVTGERLTECPTDNFGPAHILYTINSEETVKVYPATDGSNYVCLYSLNLSLAQYLELPADSMKQIIGIMEANGIEVLLN